MKGAATPAAKNNGGSRGECQREKSSAKLNGSKRDRDRVRASIFFIPIHTGGIEIAKLRAYEFVTLTIIIILIDMYRAYTYTRITYFNITLFLVLKKKTSTA